MDAYIVNCKPDNWETSNKYSIFGLKEGTGLATLSKGDLIFFRISGTNYGVKALWYFDYAKKVTDQKNVHLPGTDYVWMLNCKKIITFKQRFSEDFQTSSKKSSKISELYAGGLQKSIIAVKELQLKDYILNILKEYRDELDTSCNYLGEDINVKEFLKKALAQLGVTEPYIEIEENKKPGPEQKKDIEEPALQENKDLEKPAAEQPKKINDFKLERQKDLDKPLPQKKKETEKPVIQQQKEIRNAELEQPEGKAQPVLQRKEIEKPVMEEEKKIKEPVHEQHKDLEKPSLKSRQDLVELAAKQEAATEKFVAEEPEEKDKPVLEQKEDTVEAVPEQQDVIYENISTPEKDKSLKEIPVKTSKQLQFETVGERINLPILNYAPLNEKGVIFLFGNYLQSLGFSHVEEIKEDFPDAIAVRSVGNGKYARVRIEFELNSSSFLEHGNDMNGCDLIVCWKHDWNNCPVEVIELSSILFNK